MAYERKQSEDLAKLVKNGKKFVRYQEGAELYSIGLNNFTKIAQEAGAVYRVGRIVLVNTKLVDEYLEIFREEER